MLLATVSPVYFVFSFYCLFSIILLFFFRLYVRFLYWLVSFADGCAVSGGPYIDPEQEGTATAITYIYILSPISLVLSRRACTNKIVLKRWQFIHSWWIVNVKTMAINQSKSRDENCQQFSSLLLYEIATILLVHSSIRPSKEVVEWRTGAAELTVRQGYVYYRDFFSEEDRLLLIFAVMVRCNFCFYFHDKDMHT